MADLTIFRNAVAAALRNAGIDAKNDGIYLVVAGCKFDAEETRNEKGIKFLGSRFKMAENGDFDVAKAVGLVIAVLPERLKAKESEDRYSKARKQLRELYPNAAQEVEQRNMYWHRMQIEPGIYLSAGPEGLEITMRGVDPEKVDRIVEVLKNV